MRASSPQKKRQRPVFIRSAGFQPATMLPKAAAKMAALPVNKKQAVVNMRKMAAFPGGRLADRDT